MKIIQSPLFCKTIKKFHKNEKAILDQEIKRFMKNPDIGVQKKGALNTVFIHKFKIHTLQYLLAYRKNIAQLELIMIGPHENYYRDLQKYISHQ